MIWKHSRDCIDLKYFVIICYAQKQTFYYPCQFIINIEGFDKHSRSSVWCTCTTRVYITCTCDVNLSKVGQSTSLIATQWVSGFHFQQGCKTRSSRVHFHYAAITTTLSFYSVFTPRWCWIENVERLIINLA